MGVRDLLFTVSNENNNSPFSLGDDKVIVVSALAAYCPEAS
jgi:hypothetical protein